MKKVLFLFLIMGLLLSCESDDDNIIVSDPPSLVGSWILTEWYDTEPRDIDNDGIESTNLLEQWDGCNKYSKMILYENGSGELIYIGPNDNPNCPEGLQTNESYSAGPWETESPPVIFTLIGDDFVDPYYIVELSETSLILQGSGFLTCCDESISSFTGGFLKFERE